MNRMDNSSRRDSGPGRSRAKGAGRNSSGSRARGSASYRSGQAGRMNASQTARKNSSYRRKKDPNYKLIALIGVILLVVILCVALALHSRGKSRGFSPIEGKLCIVFFRPAFSYFVHIQ